MIAEAQIDEFLKTYLDATHGEAGVDAFYNLANQLVGKKIDFEHDDASEIFFNDFATQMHESGTFDYFAEKCTENEENTELKEIFMNLVLYDDDLSPLDLENLKLSHSEIIDIVQSKGKLDSNMSIEAMEQKLKFVKECLTSYLMS